MRFSDFISIIVLIAIFFTFGCEKTQNNSNATLAAIDLIRFETAQLEVLYFPKEAETYVALNPDILEKTWSYKITFRKFQHSPIKDDLIAAIENSSIIQTNVTGDLRWACIFYNTNSVRVLTMYFDAAGNKGFIQGKSVASNGKFVKCLERMCSSLWK